MKNVYQQYLFVSHIKISI